MTVRVLLGQPEGVRNDRRATRWIEYLFLFIGLIALDYYIWVNVDTTFYQAYESWAFDRQVKGQSVSYFTFLASELGLASSESAESATDATIPNGPLLPGDANSQPQSPLATGNATAEGQSVIGRILVPRLNLSAMVREGVEDNTLRRAVGHIPSSPLPGQMGNVALAGHRDTFFRKLRDIRKTDTIVLSTLKGNYDYLVESTRIVTPQDVGVLRSLPGEQVLTLVTCFPFNYVGSAPKRFIVRARQVDTTLAQPK